ncbi:MAG: V-type ATPase subunit [Candidatus Krumholzibacteria bacterium]|nr:V-type ATPase subunit [Candidatus Krumholzibacteria bacterium]
MAEDYTYIVARLRALEAAMPERSWFERLVRTPGESLMGTLREHYHGFESTSDLAEFEKALEADKAEMLELISSLLREERTRQFIRAGYDFDNLTHAWKAARLEAKPALTRFGLVETQAIEQAATGKGGGTLPPYLEGHVQMLDATLEDKKSIAACEYAAEAAKWRFLAKVAPGEEGRSYLRCKIDSINIKNMIRLRKVRLRTEALDAIWIEGGEIDAARLGTLFRESEEELFSFLATSVRGRLISLGLGKDTPLWKVESIMRASLMELLEESRYRVFDVSPVLYHIELRERDYGIIRIAIVSRLNRLNEEAALERVNALFA